MTKTAKRSISIILTVCLCLLCFVPGTPVKAATQADYTATARSILEEYYAPEDFTDTCLWNIENGYTQKAYADQDQLENIYQTTDEITADTDTTEEQIKAVHDWIVTNIDYADDLSNYTGYPYEDLGNPFTVYKNGEAVCYGFANLTQLMLQHLDIPCIIVRGAGHVWNAVYLNGEWVFTDNTFDESLTTDNSISYRYYMMEDDAYSTNHKTQCLENWQGDICYFPVVVNPSYTYHTVYFDSKGGCIEKFPFYEGQSQMMVPIPSREGRTFVKWENDSNLNSGYQMKGGYYINGTQLSGLTDDIHYKAIYNKVDPEYDIPTGLEGTQGDDLSTVTLPAGFTWDNPGQVMEAIGEQTYTATFTPEDTDDYNIVKNISIKVNVKEEPIALVYTFAGFDWKQNEAGEYIGATANYTTQTGSETKEAEITKSVIKEASCEAEGTIEYTANISAEASPDGQAHSETKTLSIPATGHEWGDVDYKWAEDLSTVTATRTCANNPSHIETETVNATSSIVGENDVNIEIKYTATFSNPAFKTQTRTIFEIKPEPEIASIENCTVKLPAESYEYTGAELRPEPVVNNSIKGLKKGQDYTVSYSNNINAGTAKVTITGIGSYEGTIEKTFSITAKDISASTVTLSQTSAVYTGSQIKPSVTVKLGAKTLKAGTDYAVTYSNNINAGTATVTIQGKGNYKGIIRKSFIVTQKAITPSVVLSGTSYVYNGSVRKPAVTVKYGSMALKNGTDYTVTYPSGMKNVGTYTVKVTLKGNFKGQKSVSYKIIPQGTKITSLSSTYYNFTAKWNKQATQTTGYQIQYSTNSGFKSGNAVMTVPSPSTVTKTTPKLTANKKYYVRVRTYRTVGGVNYYSAWSGASTITTKPLPYAYSSSLAAPTVVSVKKNYKNGKPYSYTIKVRNNSSKGCTVSIAPYTSKPSAYNAYKSGKKSAVGAKATKTITIYTSVKKGTTRTIYASSFVKNGKTDLYSKVSNGIKVKW